MSAPKTQDPRQQLAMQLHSVAVHLLRRVRQDDRTSTGLTPARASLLSILVFGGPHTIGQLSAAEQVSFPTITKLVNGLEGDGLVRRSPSRTDRRVITVVATARARQLMKRGRARRIKYLLELLEALPEDGWSTIQDAVTLLEHTLTARVRTDPASRLAT